MAAFSPLGFAWDVHDMRDMIWKVSSNPWHKQYIEIIMQTAQHPFRTLFFASYIITLFTVLHGLNLCSISCCCQDICINKCECLASCPGNTNNRLNNVGWVSLRHESTLCITSLLSGNPPPIDCLTSPWTNSRITGSNPWHKQYIEITMQTAQHPFRTLFFASYIITLFTVLHGLNLCSISCCCQDICINKCECLASCPGNTNNRLTNVGWVSLRHESTLCITSLSPPPPLT